MEGKFQTYLIDGRLGNQLTILEDPKVIKVMHSCLSGDLGWLQRDYGVQLVNVLDVQYYHKK